MKRQLPIVITLLLLVFASLSGAWQQYRHFLVTPLNITESNFIIHVKPGSNIKNVVLDLTKRKATQIDWRWRVLQRLQVQVIKTGEYRLAPGLTPPELLRLLASGKVVTYRFTIVEGWSLEQLLAALAKNTVLEHKVDNVEILEDLPWFNPQKPEGWFLPETYAFVRGDSDLDILKRAHSDMQKTLTRIWAERDAELPYETPGELLTMASIIEKETSLKSERRAIAGVFVRRLLHHWRLETDPTVIYGMGGNYQGNIHRRDLKRDTPYNTYTRFGLPPTPIALPGIESLRAAAHPLAGDAMFFVADGKGGHTFSATLKAHNHAVKQMLRKNQDPKR